MTTRKISAEEAMEERAHIQEYAELLERRLGEKNQGSKLRWENDGTEGLSSTGFLAVIVYKKNGTRQTWRASACSGFGMETVAKGLYDSKEEAQIAGELLWKEILSGNSQIPPSPPQNATMDDTKKKGLRDAADPLLKFLNENYHPHVTVIVTPTSVELMEGIMAIPKILDHVKD